MRIIDKLKLPEDIKNINSKQINDLVQDLIDKMIDLSKLRSIHFSSNLAVIHLTIALLKVFNPLIDELVFDVGHQTYIYKMLTDRLDKINTIRTEGGLSGFQDPKESKYDKYSAGHAATSISAATGIYFGLKKAEKAEKNVIAIIGDASLSSGLSLEAIESNSYLKAPIIIIINDNNMSIGKNLGSLHDVLVDLQLNSKQKNNFFTNLGYEYIGVIDGHNINDLTNALENAKKIKTSLHKSVVVHVKTTKGYGYKLDDTGSLHSYKFEVDTNNNIRNNNGFYLANGLIERRKQKDDFLIISPSMTYSTGFSYFKDEFPNNFIDLGIQEENAITIASGIAIKKNYRPIVVTYSTFIQRAYDQLLHDVARMELGVTLLLDRSDIAAFDGSSHMGIYDVAMLKSIPNTIITSGITKEQNLKLLNLSIELNPNKIFTIRYATKSFCNNQELIDKINSLPIIYKQWQVLNHDIKNEICFISYGTYYLEILNNFLSYKNISFINALFINYYNKQNLEWIFKQNFKKIIVYERVNNVSSLALDVEEYILSNNLNVKLIKLGYSGFITHAELNSIDKKFNMDIESLKKLLN